MRQLICTSLCAAVVVTGFKCAGASSPPPSLTTSAALRVSKSIFFFSRGFILDCIVGCNLFHCCCKHAPHALLPRHVFTLSLAQGCTQINHLILHINYPSLHLSAETLNITRCENLKTYEHINMCSEHNLNVCHDNPIFHIHISVLNEML